MERRYALVHRRMPDGVPYAPPQCMEQPGTLWVPAGLPSCGTPILRAAFSRLPHPRAVLGAAAAQYGRTTHCGHVGRPGEGALPPRQEALPARRKQSSKYE